MQNCRPGTRKHKPTLITKAKVVAFNCAGFTFEQIANYLKISVPTLEKYYREELDCGKLDRLGAVSESAYKRAIDGNDKMTELILRTQARWTNARPPEEIQKDNLALSLLEEIKANTKK